MNQSILSILILTLLSYSAFASTTKTFVCKGQTDTLLMELDYNYEDNLVIRSMVFDETPFLEQDIIVHKGKLVASPDEALLHEVLIIKDDLNLTFSLYNVSQLEEIFVKTDQDFIQCDPR